MPTDTQHQRAERRMRRILTDSDLPEPDEVEYREDSLLFMWHETKTAVIVDLDEVPGAPPGAASEGPD